MIQFWTDGSGVFSEHFQEPTGYACVARVEDFVVELAARSPFGTNNTAELSGAIMALNSINPAYQGPVRIHTDSLYVLNQAQGLHRTNTNFDLVRMLQDLNRERSIRPEWVHVKGHSGDWGNERCDVLAGLARKSEHRPEAYFTHVRIYHQSDPSKVLLDKAMQPVNEIILGGQRCVVRLLI